MDAMRGADLIQRHKAGLEYALQRLHFKIKTKNAIHMFSNLWSKTKHNMYMKPGCFYQEETNA